MGCYIRQYKRICVPECLRAGTFHTRQERLRQSQSERERERYRIGRDDPKYTRQTSFPKGIRLCLVCVRVCLCVGGVHVFAPLMSTESLDCSFCKTSFTTHSRANVRAPHILCLGYVWRALDSTRLPNIILDGHTHTDTHNHYSCRSVAQFVSAHRNTHTKQVHNTRLCAHPKCVLLGCVSLALEKT